MPTQTKADAIEEAAKDLKKALEGGIPQSNIDKEAIKKLMEIFKNNAEATKNENFERQRVQKRRALEQRVYLENKQREFTLPAEFEKENPEFNTRARGVHKVSAQETLFRMLNISGTGAKLSSQDLAGMRFPIQFKCNWANSVINGETEELLGYRHLMKRPEYKEAWGHSSGNESGQLCQGIEGRAIGTDTMFFMHKREVPADRFKDDHQN